MAEENKCPLQGKCEQCKECNLCDKINPEELEKALQDLEYETPEHKED